MGYKLSQYDMKLIQLNFAIFQRELFRGSWPIMGNESSASSTTSSEDESGANDQTQNDNPIVATNDFGTSPNSTKKFLIYGSSSSQFKAMLFIQYISRLNEINIPSAISYLCSIYLGDKAQTDHFDKENKEIRCILNNINTKCTLSSNGANTIYGSFKVDINKYPEISLYRWTLKVLNKKENIYIGIDSNPIFSRSDFSNCFRDFKFSNFKSSKDEKRDRFCAYSSDGDIYHYHSQVAHKYGTKWRVNDKITMLIDVKKEALMYYVNDEYQGIAMDQLMLNKKVYSLAVALFYEDDAVELQDFAVNC